MLTVLKLIIKAIIMAFKFGSVVEAFNYVKEDAEEVGDMYHIFFG